MISTSPGDNLIIPPPTPTEILQGQGVKEIVNHPTAVLLQVPVVIYIQFCQTQNFQETTLNTTVSKEISDYVSVLKRMQNCKSYLHCYFQHRRMAA